MSGHLALMAKRRERPTSGTGAVAFKCCPVCRRQVLSAYRGEVTAVGKGEIQSVAPDGSVIGVCECGKRVTWEREVARK